MFLYGMTDEIDPASGTIDLSGSFNCADVPQILGFMVWLSTVGGVLAAGSFIQINLTHTDIEGISRNGDGVMGGIVSLDAADSSFTTPMRIITRESNSAPLQLDCTLVGPTDGAKIRIVIFSTNPSSESAGGIAIPPIA